MNELLIGHIVIAFSALFPAALLQMINYKKTKDFIGYNTARGLKSQETREFSVKYATKGMFWAGLATVCVQILLYFYVGGETAILLTALTMTLGFIIVLILTEVQLAARFDEDGKPKELLPKY